MIYLARCEKAHHTMNALFDHGYALVVGVGADLPMTVNDAQAIAAQLQDPRRCAYPPEHVRLLTNEQARRQSILDGLDWLAMVTGPNDTAVVYFSGHGIENPDYHFVPFGFDWGDLANTAITGRAFTDQLRTIQASKLLVLLDCCHAGGLAEAKSAIKSPLPAAAMETLKAGSGRVIVASSRSGELSWADQQCSYFTAAVLESLAGYGAFEQDGIARVLDLTLWVGRKVPERSKDQQHPIVKVNNLADNFALAWYAGGAKTLSPLTWSAISPPTSPSAPSSAQITTWRRMLANKRDNLLLIEERMSEYVDIAEVPLQLIRNKRHTEAEISELESRIGA